MLGRDFDGEELPAFDGWETLEKLGEGGMCAVYRARPADGGPERALKLLNDRSEHSIQRFGHEARLLARLVHPNVVRVHALHDDVRPPWIVMDLLTGRDLEERMHDEGPMDPERAARLFADLASGLAAVHAAGVRHRDIKPANIMLGDEGVPRLIDFGIARDTASAHVTKKGFVVGTASYLPPEIFTDEDSQQVQDAEVADVYALGQTLCEVLAGRPVHPRGDMATQATLLVRIMRDKLDRPYLDPRDAEVPVPDALARIVRAATMREPLLRLSTARDFQQQLLSWLATRSAGEEAAPVTWVDPASIPPLPPRQETPVVAATPAPAAPRATPAPAVVRTAAVGAAGAVGVAGMGAVLAGIAAVAVLGGILLWMFRPSSPFDEVNSVVGRHATDFADCPGSARHGTVRVSVSVLEGRATGVDITESSVEKRTTRCVQRILQSADYPTHPKPYTVEVPVTFR